MRLIFAIKEASKREARTLCVKVIKPVLHAERERILNHILTGSGIVGTEGDRMFPSNKDKDAFYGFRLDWGRLQVHADGTITRSFDLQFNKGAENATIRKLASSNSHMKRVTFVWDIDENGIPRKSKDELSDDFDVCVSEIIENGL